MRNESSVSKLDRLVRGRTLIIVAVADALLFLIANVAYGAGNQHGLRNSVSNVTWALFLVGFLLLVVCAIVCLAQVIRRRVKAHA